MELIPKFPEYAITRTGRIWSFPRQGSSSLGRWLKPYKDSQGYFQVSLYEEGKRTNKLVHHLVLEVYGQPRKKGQIARHLNGNKIDNRNKNLVWGTHKENSDDMIKHNTVPNRKGESNGRAKLTIEEVKLIRKLYLQPKISLWFLARHFNMSLYAIWAVVTRKTWKHV